MKNFIVPIEISARHVHLTKEDLEKLYGKGYVLSVKKNVSQPGQFSALETINIIGPRQTIKDVRIVGPLRAKTQLEISVTDSFVLGISIPPVRVSGDLADTPGGVDIEGPEGTISLRDGIIVAQRHLHIEPEKAREFGIQDKDLIDIRVDSKRPIIYKNVIVRSKEHGDSLSFQLDTDEANAGYIGLKDKGYII